MGQERYRSWEFAEPLALLSVCLSLAYSPNRLQRRIFPSRSALAAAPILLSRFLFDLPEALVESRGASCLDAIRPAPRAGTVRDAGATTKWRESRRRPSLTVPSTVALVVIHNDGQTAIGSL